MESFKSNTSLQLQRQADLRDVLPAKTSHIEWTFRSLFPMMFCRDVAQFSVSHGHRLHYFPASWESLFFRCLCAIKNWAKNSFPQVQADAFGSVESNKSLGKGAGWGVSFPSYVMPSQMDFFSVSEGIVPAFRFVEAHKWTAYFLMRFLWH